VTEGTKERDRGAGGTRRCAAAWLAWSLVTLSVALLLGGIALARTTRSTVPELPYGGEAELGSAFLSLATLLTFSVVEAIVASHHPQHHRLALLQHRIGSRPQRPRRGLRRVPARKQFWHKEPR